MTPEGPGGRVCSLDPDSGEVRVEVDGLRYPNGLVFDGDVLYVAETGTRRILRFRAEPDGLVSEGVWHELTEGHPDGLALGADGRLYVAGTDGHAVYVVAPDGSADRPIRLAPGALPTNCCLAPDGRTLFVTAAQGGRVLAVDLAAAS